MTRYFQASKLNNRPATSHALRPPPWRVALIANLKDGVEWGPGAPPDAGAEFDRQETLDAIAGALESDGHWVHVLHADQTLPETLTNLRPHICFNIAEGMGGDAREAQVPALCELLAIPYTASRVLANALSLDKTQTKRIWQSLGLPTARFQEFRRPEEALDPSLRLPLMVKPAREGTGMGVDPRAVVRTRRELTRRVAWVLRTYQQPCLVEEYLPGREFTVGILGNRGAIDQRRRPHLYRADGYHAFPILEIDNQVSVSPGIYGYDAKSRDVGAPGAPGYLCPADLPAALAEELFDLTRRAAEAIDAADVARVDLRLDGQGRPHLMEINTLPGLNPRVSDLCLMAAAQGMPYRVLITEILYLAAERFGLPLHPLGYPQAVGVEAEAMATAMVG
jgi:D-alanine-D-alanine ligase